MQMKIQFCVDLLMKLKHEMKIEILNEHGISFFG